MKHGNLSREEAIELAGIENVMAVEKMNCEPTSRCQTDGDNDIEYTASMRLPNGDTLVAYYYMDGDWRDSLPEDVDADDLWDWEIHGWEIE
jgi:hypothetical protein